MVLDAGNLAEFDAPHRLLQVCSFSCNPLSHKATCAQLAVASCMCVAQNPQSLFARTVSETGPGMSRELHRIAAETVSHQLS